MPDVEAIPSWYPRVTPYLVVEGASAAIDFYSDIFGAVDRVRMPGPDGTIGHAEMAIGESMIMLADASEMSGPTPSQLGGSPVTLMVYVEDVDDVFTRALAAGATETRALEDRFYGDRSGQFTDPLGSQ